MSVSNTFVLSITHLKDKPNEDHALEMLKKTTSLVKPIMRKHGWVLPELSEFFPDNPNLLGMNVNGGQKILLRLRPHHSPTWFYEQEEIIGTMLHELTHNIHGPHDDKFYKFLADLQKEYDELQRTGYAGEGFFTSGKRLGGSRHNPAPHLARLKALEAAEKRRQVTNALGVGGPKKLGGTDAPRPMTPRELAAQAAERRARDLKTCGSQQNPDSIQRESDKASRDGVTNDVIDLTIDDADYWEPDWISDHESDDEVIIVKDVHPSPVAGPSRLKSNPVSSSRSVRPVLPTGPIRANMTKDGPPVSKAPYARPAQKSKAEPSSTSYWETEWGCLVCTLVNTPTALQCDACGMRRPPDEAAGWACLTCGETGMPHQFWTCRLCGTVKLHS